jgi:hypothetical protein
MVAWRKNSRAQMMAKQRVAVVDEADCARRPAPRRSTIVDIAAPIKGLAHRITESRRTMTADWTPAQIPSDSNSSRMLNTAQGILIGIRRCDSEAAFNELLGAAQRNRVPVFAMAWALVHLASHGDKTESCSARTAARREWGRLFAASAESTA